MNKIMDCEIIVMTVNPSFTQGNSDPTEYEDIGAVKECLRQTDTGRSPPREPTRMYLSVFTRWFLTPTEPIQGGLGQSESHQLYPAYQHFVPDTCQEPEASGQQCKSSTNVIDSHPPSAFPSSLLLELFWLIHMSYGLCYMLCIL